MLGVTLTVKGHTDSIPKNSILLNHAGAGDDEKNITINTEIILLGIELRNCTLELHRIFIVIFPSPTDISYARETK